MGSRIAKNHLEALETDELQKSKSESTDLQQQFLQRMDEKFDELKKSISEKLLALEKKDPTANITSESVRNSLENEQQERGNSQPEVPTFVQFQIKFRTKTNK
ncbi:unnamed protein product [Spirodela intermedia]|uniref:Uncharacterized protein n=1 Tax=Spirodela intermedia TaxID=51605 RepID=A0A7I8IM42_SPIIN|nr:unnamed protein product [Spirodela intermedia]CAA6658508.1 unnamed protein product [Spirodela intermedia]